MAASLRSVPGRALRLRAGARAVLGAAEEKKGYTLEPLDEAAPEKEVAAAIRDVLAPKGLRILSPDGKPFVDLWLRKSIATVEDPKTLGIDYGNVPDGTLIGAARWAAEGKDFRDHAFPAGVFTLRKMTQPEDGDHLGVSATRDFVLICSAKEDTKPANVDQKAAVELSRKAAGVKHPKVLYLLEVFDKAEKLPRVFEDKENEYWIVDLELPDDAKGKDPVRLSIVVVGKAAEA